LNFNNQQEKRPMTREMPGNISSTRRNKKENFSLVSDMVATIHGVPSDLRRREQSDEVIKKIMHSKIAHRHHLKYERPSQGFLTSRNDKSKIGIQRD
jgi:predicted membrane chloride channel (bestrophin family)